MILCNLLLHDSALKNDALMTQFGLVLIELVITCESDTHR